MSQSMMVIIDHIKDRTDRSVHPLNKQQNNAQRENQSH